MHENSIKVSEFLTGRADWRKFPRIQKFGGATLNQIVGVLSGLVRTWLLQSLHGTGYLPAIRKEDVSNVLPFLEGEYDFK